MVEASKVVPLTISKLVPQSNGNFVILINGNAFGEISAYPKAAFVINEGIDPKTNKPKIRVLEAGSYDYDFNGRKLKIDVKDLQLTFSPVGHGSRNTEDQEFKAQRNNEKAQEELMGRVSVIEVF